jgi:hypothetical protein
MLMKYFLFNIDEVFLLRVWELVSSCENFVGWVGDCSGCLKSAGCLSDLELGDES